MSSREVCFRLLGFHKTLCLSKQNRVDWGGEGQQKRPPGEESQKVLLNSSGSKCYIIVEGNMEMLAHKNILNHTHQAWINLEYIDFDCNAWLTIRFEYNLRSSKIWKNSEKMECRKGHTWVRITYEYVETYLLL